MLRFICRNDRPFTPAARRALLPYDGVLAQLLFSRGVDTAPQADAFLAPGLQDLHDPSLLSGMEAALALLAQAKAERWPTVVYGDYDTDGVCAAAIAVEALNLYGIPAEPHVPLRAEGYGLNLAAVEELAKHFKLLVTVDLGITNAAEVARARELGLRVIVTDHHQPGLTPCPADAVINPVLGGYPFPRLCGAGVAYKLAWALLGEETARQWLDLAAVATVADIVPLLSENRAIVALGLPQISARPGLTALAEAAGCTMPLTSEAVAYQLAPRLNAAGRIDDARLSVRLLLTRDSGEAKTLAKQLDQANAQRRQMEQDATAQAEAQAETHDFVNKRMLFVRGDDWPAGVIGLVAGRLNRRFGVPVCALCGEGELLHGSLRGVHGLNLARCLQTCDELLLRYGGHEMAAGVTLESANDEAFRKRLEQAVREALPDGLTEPAQEYDAVLPLGEADEALVSTLSRLEPFGLGNPAPVFYTENLRLLRRRACGARGAHLQFTFGQGASQLSGIAFGMGALSSTLPDAVDAAYTLGRNEFNGRVSVQAQAQALRPSPAALPAAITALPHQAFELSLLNALTQEVAACPTLLAGNSAPDAEVMKATPECLFTAEGQAAQLESLLTGRQGTLLVAYAPETAQKALAAFGDRVDCVQGAPEDPRCFHTLLYQPEPSAVHGNWQTVALLDGPLTPASLAHWQSLLPGALVYAAAPSQALTRLAAALDAGDARYRTLYRLLRAGVYTALSQLAHEAELTEPQALLGLTAFAGLGFIDFSASPFRYTLREARKRPLSDSPVLGALRALATTANPHPDGGLLC